MSTRASRTCCRATRGSSIRPTSGLRRSGSGSDGTLPAGSYVYAVTDDFAAGGGQSIASVSAPVTVTGAEGIGHADLGRRSATPREFKIYREVAGSNEWKLIATMPAPTTAPPNSWFASPTANTPVTGGGPLEVRRTPTRAPPAPRPRAPPAASEAVETAYPQNPNLIPAFAGVGIQYFGSDASKPYPDPTIAGQHHSGLSGGLDVHRRNGPGDPALPDQHLLQRLDRGRRGRRVQRPLHAGRRGREMRGQRDHHV